MPSDDLRSVAKAVAKRELRPCASAPPTGRICKSSAWRRPSRRDETLDFILDWGRGALERQLSAADALDAKMAQALAAGSILLGLAASSGADGVVIAVFLGLAALAFIVLAIAAVRALWLRRFRAPMAPSQAWRKYWTDEVTTIQWAIVDDTSAAYEENERHLDCKRNALRWALSALAAEAGLIGAAVIAAGLA